MKKFGLKDGLTLICTISAIGTSIVIVLTFLTMYHFINTMQIFDSYQPLQIGLSITMILWAIRFSLYKVGKEKHIYSLICLVTALISIIFMINMVK